MFHCTSVSLTYIVSSVCAHVHRPSPGTPTLRVSCATSCSKGLWSVSSGSCHWTGVGKVASVCALKSTDAPTVSGDTLTRAFSYIYNSTLPKQMQINNHLLKYLILFFSSSEILRDVIYIYNVVIFPFIKYWLVHATQLHMHSPTRLTFQVNWLLQPLCSHPIKSCQIDFDNNFQLRLRTKLLFEGTLVHHSAPALVCLSVRTCNDLRCIQVISVLFPSVIFPAMLKVKNLIRDKEDMMCYK